MPLRCTILLGLIPILAACATPLGPGYRIEQQTYELRHVAGSPTVLQVHAAYRLRNVGNAPLTSIGVLLPDAESLGRRNLRVCIDGREAAPQNPADATAATIEVPFDRPWTQGARREILLEYELVPAAPGHSGISVAEGSSHVRHFGWFPELRRPEAPFAKAVRAPEKIRTTIRVPAGFQVLASGHDRGTRRTASGVEYRFEMHDDDPSPFLVAGRYVEARFPTQDGDVVFWTFQPLDREMSARAAERIARSHNTFDTSFGRLSTRPHHVYIVETHARLTPRATGADGPAGIGFPLGALLNSAAFALDLNSDAFLGLVEHELAHAWFGQALRPRRESDLLLSEALAEYATIAAVEAREGQAARRHRAALLLRWYDEARNHAVEKSLDALRPADPWEQRVFAYNKGALFFLALEDEVGKDALHRGLARLVHALSNRDDAGINDLRAAIEGEAGRDLADFFRAWLYRTGIPDDFRARYEVKKQ